MGREGSGMENEWELGEKYCWCFWGFEYVYDYKVWVFIWFLWVLESNGSMSIIFWGF